MEKAESPSSGIVGVSAVTDIEQTSFISDLKSLIKIGIVNSNLLTVFTGFWLALYFTGSSFMANWDIFLFTMAGSAFVIIGGCIINNWFDVDIDPVMTRTKTRPTVTGNISLNTALVLGIGSTVLGLILLLFTTVQAALFAFLGWFVYVVLYTMWSKRRYTLNTAIGSFSGAAPPLIGWAAVEQGFHIVPFILFLLMFIWQTPHFLALAIKKKNEYKRAGIPMLPAVHGFDITKRQIVIYIACLLPLPFYLASLGSAFVIIASILNAGWLVLGISGFFMKNDLKWANMIFIYSLNYLMIIFLTMITVTVNVPFS